jgi:hypothetical protein
VANFMTRYAHMGIKVYSIGFGSGCNMTILKDIAQVGGTNEAMKALSFSELNQAFQNIIKKELTEVVIHEFIRNDNIITEDIIKKLKNRFSNEIPNEEKNISKNIEAPTFNKLSNCSFDMERTSCLRYRGKDEPLLDERKSNNKLEKNDEIKKSTVEIVKVSSIKIIIARFLAFVAYFEQYLVPTHLL